VLDADERQSLVRVRALGRAGFRVGAFDAARVSTAYSSRWCSLSLRLPEASHEDVFVHALLPRYGGSGRARCSRRATARSRRCAPGGGDRGRGGAGAAAGCGACGRGGQGAEARAGRAPRVRVPISEPRRSGDDARLSGGRTGFPAVIQPVQALGAVAAGRQTPELCRRHRRRRGAYGRRAGDAACGRVVLQQWVRGGREAVSHDQPGADALAMTPNTPRPS
jgi:hypothetical protein